MNGPSRFKVWRELRSPRLGLLLGGMLVLAILLELPYFPGPTRPYSVGEFASENIKANRRYEIIDPEATEIAVQDARQGMPDIYDFDPDMIAQLVARISDVFDELRDEGPNRREEDERHRLSIALGITISRADWQLLKNINFSIRAQTFLVRVLEPLRGKWIVHSREELKRTAQREILIRPLEGRSASESVVSRDSTNILSLDEARGVIEKTAEELRSSLPPAVRRRLLHLAKELVKPSVFLNREETERRELSLRAQLPPVAIVVEKGEMVVREGERISKRQQLILEGMIAQRSATGHLSRILALAATLAGLSLVIYLFCSRSFRRFRISFRDECVLFSLLGLSVVLSLLFIGISLPSDQSFFGTSAGDFVRFTIPFATSAMLLRLITSSEITLVFAVIQSLVMGTLFEYDMIVALYSLVGSLFGSYFMGRCTQRIDIVRAGALVGVVNAAFLLFVPLLNPVRTIGLYDAQLFLTSDHRIALMLAIASGGLLSGGLVLFLQPVLEYFGYTTDIRLLELSNTNHPLLKELHIKAPGTFSHTLSVSLLAEAAAESIGANSLLARVAALYHDVGKARKPLYFVENQKSENRHDKLTPSMSALIIASHVKEGIEMAESHKIPQAIIDVIPQHHGTSLMTFFYEKAKKLHSEDDVPVDESEYRYPGPKPQTREAGIIMLADGVEATARAVTQPTLDRLQAVVQSIINKFFTDGQLNECDLTLRDLETIAQAFVRVLSGIYHHRIDYPGTTDITRPAAEEPRRIGIPKLKTKPT